jgi:protocatechuate 3,4-dioxygenase beta subunit
MDGSEARPTDRLLLGQLTSRLERQSGQRLADAFVAGARALHELVGILRPSGEEFRAAIEFLTEVGHASDERRQEWVLLADVIGVSSLIEDLNAPRPFGATPNTLPGPFYRPDVPEVANGSDLSRDGKGEPMTVTGRIRALDGRPVPAALVEIWGANAEGLYENQDPDQQPEFNLRGRLHADAEGQFTVHTVRPGRTRLPGDGPVGRLMASLGLGLERPAHLHVRVTAEGFQPLVTHLFDRDDPIVGCDPIFGVKPALLHSFRADTGAGPARARLDVTLALCPAGGAA